MHALVTQAYARERWATDACRTRQQAIAHRTNESGGPLARRFVASQMWFEA
jgi:hypothetical protein